MSDDNNSLDTKSPARLNEQTLSPDGLGEFEAFWLKSLTELENFNRTVNYVFRVEMYDPSLTKSISAKLIDEEITYVFTRHFAHHEQRWLCTCIVDKRPERHSKQFASHNLLQAADAAFSSVFGQDEYV